MRLLPALVLGLPILAQAAHPCQDRAERFLQLVNAGTQSLTYVAQEATWAAATDVSPVHDAGAEAAGKALAAFAGNKVLLLEARDLLAHRDELKPLTVRELERTLLNAAEGPMTNPALTQARIAAETAQASTMNGFIWHWHGQPISANGIDDLLARSTDLAERRGVWEASKENGKVLREGLLRLRELRNGCAQELGYPDYFALQVAKYQMTAPEMVAMHRRFLQELRPLYLQLHTWVKYELARKYGQPVPRAIPAHWINNRWSQNWTGLVDGVDFDPYFRTWSPERIVKTAERFYTGLGFPPLPDSFWVKSGRKNSHASCWHLDLDTDIRGLMSVENNMEWFSTAHHELGHAYYFISYTNPQVPPLLRDSANPGFHEGIGELIALATRQLPYLKDTGVLPADYQADDMKILLNDALELAIPFMFWSSGTMLEWEDEFYAKAMPAPKLNARWWEIVRAEQGVEPPAPRGEAFCDAATKTHINDTPAYYYNYAVATVFKFQMHDYICKRILHQDVHAANYANRKDVGAFLHAMLAKGATEDWRKVLKEATGEDLSTRAMAEYFKPLMAWLEHENRGRQVGWD